MLRHRAEIPNCSSPDPNSDLGSKNLELGQSKFVFGTAQIKIL